MNHELLPLHPETCRPKPPWYLHRRWFGALAGVGLVTGFLFGPRVLSFACELFR